MYGQRYPYVDAVIRAGGVPVILPLTTETAVWEEFYEYCDGILFAGGNDIDPTLYKAEVTRARDISVKRDAQEMALLRRALNENKPLLAICRGLQLLNVACGGSLFQDITAEVSGAEDHETSTHQQSMEYIAHELELDSESRLAKILGVSKIRANSHHHQAVKDVGRPLQIAGRAADGIIEALESPEHDFVIGVQSHPECLEASVEPQWRQLFTAFIVASKGL